MSIDPRKSSGAEVAVLGCYPIRTPLDAFAARRGVRAHAAAMGFERRACEELTLVGSELCTNIVKYGEEGRLSIERVELVKRGLALVISAEDIGRPFRDFEAAILDGKDDRGSIPPEALYGRVGIGAGLGAVRRFTHALWLEPLERGKRVVAARFLRPSMKY